MCNNYQTSIYHLKSLIKTESKRFTSTIKFNKKKDSAVLESTHQKIQKIIAFASLAMFPM